MKRNGKRQRLTTRAICVVLAAFGFASTAASAELSVAVASNFAVTLTELADLFSARSGHRLRVSAASTGKLYAQVINGAPFDVLLAADRRRPALLEQSGHTVAGSRFTYASGRLVLWSRDAGLSQGECRDALRDGRGKIAIANPRTAPYGEAARSVLQSLQLWNDVQDQLVFGENIGQVLHFVATGNARLGFVADGQLAAHDLPVVRCVWRVPTSHHPAIEQQAVLLSRARQPEAARAFLDFLRSEEAKRIVRGNGYHVPASVTLQRE